MNKFSIFSCIKVKENDYAGPCIVLSCCADPSFMLFFPISEENANTVMYVLEDKGEYTIDTNILGIYKTMVDSWGASDRYLSGIIMDSVYNQEIKDEILVIRLALSNSDGEIDSLVRVSFVHAILLAAMEKVDIILSNELLAHMIPSEDILLDKFLFEKNENRKEFPEDKKIVDIARKIMSGKIKNKE